MTLAGYVTGWAAEYAAGIESVAGLGDDDAIEEYLFDMDAQWTFITDKHGEYRGARVELCPSPRVTFNPHTGIVRVRDTSAKYSVTVGVKVSKAAQEFFDEYFSTLFEMIQASRDITA